MIVDQKKGERTLSENMGNPGTVSIAKEGNGKWSRGRNFRGTQD
jgi:hypothetical protein